MKSCSSFQRRWLVVLCAMAGSILQSQAATLAVAPASTSNTYSGTLTLSIGSLTNGEAVLIQKYLDANGNGVIDAEDTLWQQFDLADGQATVFHDGAAAVTNLNVPGDTDFTPGQITAVLNLRASGFEQTIVGNYLMRLSSPFGNFSPVTNLFTITGFSHGQSFTGSVVGNSTNIPNAVVLLFQPMGNDVNPQGGALADNSGNYTISAPPGEYLLMAFKNNFVANLATSPAFTLGAGATVNTNVNLASTDRTIAGSMIDASNSLARLPGVLVPVESQNGLLGVTFTDASGNFTAGVTGDDWKVQSVDEGVALHGYLRSQEKVQVNTTTGSVASVSITYPRANAIFYGTVKDGLNQPLPGISLSSQSGDNQYDQNATTDVNGNYFAGALGGTPWRMQVGNDRNPPNYIFSSPAFNFTQNNGTNLSVGQALRVNFTALLATNHISGHVQDSNGAPVANVQLSASATIGGATYQSQGNTDGSGDYSMNVASGVWNVNVNCQGGENSLDDIFGSGNYQCPGSQSVSITNNNGIANFTVLPCGGVQVFDTSPLANGQVGVYYSMQFYGSSCSGNFLSWTLGSGTLPPGLSLYSGGALNGMPTTNGTFVFTVHVNDSGSSTNVNFSLTINPGAPAAPPVVGQPAKSGSQFHFVISGSAGQNYTVQMCTNLASSNWNSILITNLPGSSLLVTDPNATNRARFYRVLVGP